MVCHYALHVAKVFVPHYDSEEAERERRRYTAFLTLEEYDQRFQEEDPMVT